MPYIYESRSVRSQEAIDNYEVPISMITRGMINEFQLSNLNEYQKDCKIFKLPVKLWKSVATMLGPSFWHHTGKYYRKTYYYDMSGIADYLYHHYDKITRAYHRQLKENRKAKDSGDRTVKLAVLVVNVWGGSRRHRKIVGQDTVCGYLQDNWLIAYDDPQHRYNTCAKRVVSEQDFTNLQDFKKYVSSTFNLTRFEYFLRRHNKVVPAIRRIIDVKLIEFKILYEKLKVENKDLSFLF